MVLGESVRARHLLPLEEAVRLMTDTPARLLGLRDHGHIAEGAHADLVLFDPDVSPPGPTISATTFPVAENASAPSRSASHTSSSVVQRS